MKLIEPHPPCWRKVEHERWKLQPFFTVYFYSFLVGFTTCHEVSEKSYKLRLPLEALQFESALLESMEMWQSSSGEKEDHLKW